MAATATATAPSPARRQASVPNLAGLAAASAAPRSSGSPGPGPGGQRYSGQQVSNGSPHGSRPSSGSGYRPQQAQGPPPPQPQFRPSSQASAGAAGPSNKQSPARPTIDTAYANNPPYQHSYQQQQGQQQVQGQQQLQQQYFQTAPPAPNLNDPYYANAPIRDSLYPSMSSRRSQMTLPASAIEPRRDDDSRRVSAAQGPLLDQSHLRPGKSASLLTHDRTLELYRENAKKTNDPELMFEFSIFMIDAAKSMIPDGSAEQTGDATVPPTPTGTTAPRVNPNVLIEKRDELYREATTLLKKLADKGYPDAQYFLADCYANGIGTVRGRQDFDRAFPLFVLAAKHGHPDACYRAGTCCENGWGCRRENAKAVQFYKKAAVALHPGAMYRLGTAELHGNLGLSRSAKEGYKWLKRSAEHANEEFPHALHELAILYETGIDNVVFVDFEYAAELLAQASELGYAPSAFKLGECYEYGKMDCPVDPALSIHYYNIAATQNHPDACFALTAWYLVGSPGVLPQSDTEAYLWAKKAAEAGLAKAQYAVGYFTETGIGTEADLKAAMEWYKKAAEAGDKRASKRLQAGARNSALDRRSEVQAMKEGAMKDGKDGKEGCVIM